MRLLVHLLGVEVLDIAINEPATANDADGGHAEALFGNDRTANDEFEPYQDAGSTGCTVIGFTQSSQPAWERPLNHWDEPGEADEDV